MDSCVYFKLMAGELSVSTHVVININVEALFCWKRTQKLFMKITKNKQ